jgi:hypothetical protein
MQSTLDLAYFWSIFFNSESASPSPTPYHHWRWPYLRLDHSFSLYVVIHPCQKAYLSSSIADSRKHLEAILRVQPESVTAASLLRKWGVHQSQTESMSNTIAEYIPVNDAPQLFRWKGYWVEIKRSKGPTGYNPELGGQLVSATMYLTCVFFKISSSFAFLILYLFLIIRMYTRNMNTITGTSLVEHARQPEQYLGGGHVFFHLHSSLVWVGQGSMDTLKSRKFGVALRVRHGCAFTVV